LEYHFSFKKRDLKCYKLLQHIIIVVNRLITIKSRTCRTPTHARVQKFHCARVVHAQNFRGENLKLLMRRIFWRAQALQAHFDFARARNLAHVGGNRNTIPCPPNPTTGGGHVPHSYREQRSNISPGVTPSVTLSPPTGKEGALWGYSITVTPPRGGYADLYLAEIFTFFPRRKYCVNDKNHINPTAERRR